MPTLEQSQNQASQPIDQSFLISPADLAAKKAKWLQEGYTEAEADDMAKMLGRLSEIQDIEKSLIGQGEDHWKKNPAELERAEKAYEAERAAIKARREEIKRSLAGREEPKPEIEQAKPLKNLAEGLEGRDIGEFLDDIERLVQDHASKTGFNFKSPWSFNSYNDSSSFEFLLFRDEPVYLPDSLIDINSPDYSKTLYDGTSFKGLSTLRRLLKGKKFVVVLEAKIDPPVRRIFLEVIDSKNDDPKIFKEFNDKGEDSIIESTGLRESEGYKVGDRLRLKWEGDRARKSWLRRFKVAQANQMGNSLKIVGFDKKGRVVIEDEIRGEGVFVEPVDVVRGCYEHIPVNPVEFSGYKVGDLFKARNIPRIGALSDSVDLQKAKEIKLISYVHNECQLQLDGDPHSTTVVDLAYMDCFEKIN